MSADAFAILLACAAFIVGLGMGLFLATTRYQPIVKGKPVSERRMRSLWVIDPLLERGELLEHAHPTISPRGARRL